jgi:hypothetical protein
VPWSDEPDVVVADVALTVPAPADARPDRYPSNADRLDETSA